MFGETGAPGTVSGSTEVFVDLHVYDLCSRTTLTADQRRLGRRETDAVLICDHLSLISTSLQEDEVKVC